MNPSRALAASLSWPPKLVLWSSYHQILQEGDGIDCSEASVDEGKERAWTALLSFNCFHSLPVSFNLRLHTPSPTPAQKDCPSSCEFLEIVFFLSSWILCFFRVDLVEGAKNYYKFSVLSESQRKVLFFVFKTTTFIFKLSFSCYKSNTCLFQISKNSITTAQL